MKKEKQLSVLYQKQGRATQFRSKAARDEWLQKDIDKYNKVLSSNEKQENLLNDEISKLERDMAAQDEHVQNRQIEINALEDRISGYRKGFNKHKSKRDELHDKRNNNSCTRCNSSSTAPQTPPILLLITSNSIQMKTRH